ncbi:hypothetical protein K523DRAFT_325388 [Schizophyllum commune Tattone D]|nr:hypothetical protein K523DRAFT_325388 [Schizophyllum commune Tattone D]
MKFSLSGGGLFGDRYLSDAHTHQIKGPPGCQAPPDPAYKATLVQSLPIRRPSPHRP